MAVLRLERLAIGYHSDLLCHIQACVQPGSLTLLVGRNGSGKSTLLKTLAGVIPPRGGSLCWFEGQPSAKALARRVAFIFAKRVYPPYASVYEFVSYGRIPYLNFMNRLRASDKAVITGALARMGMESMAARPIGKLSDGQYQKVLIARALAQQTEVIVMDEPFVYLDFFAKREIQAVLKELVEREHKTLIAATHDMGAWATVADALWWIDVENRFQTIERPSIHDFLKKYLS